MVGTHGPCVHNIIILIINNIVNYPAEAEAVGIKAPDCKSNPAQILFLKNKLI